jgi:SAM-dependent methyltransferase/uncharacterized protein YbaR (Trm112 family)
MITDLLICPESRLPVQAVPVDEAERILGGPLEARIDGELPVVGRQPTVLLRADGEGAYPVVDGTPVLLLPELLTLPGRRRVFDLTAPRYAEAYEEMEYYNAEARRRASLLCDNGVAELEAASMMCRNLRRVAVSTASERATFPDPPAVWIDMPYESECEYDAYRHIAPVAGKRVLQVGGEGGHAVKLLLAGAAEAYVVSPMIGELEFAYALARHHGVDGRLRIVVGIAEELPFRDGSFDVLISAGCAHHWTTEVALPECARVLAPGGRFAAVDPWRAPGYRLGTRLFGKREPVPCRPLTPTRVAPLFAAFDEAGVIHHGALTRYVLIALWKKAGLELRVPTARKIQRLDDRVCSILRPLRRLGSSVALVGSKAPDPQPA